MNKVLCGFKILKSLSYTVPSPVVEVTTLNIPTLGQSTTLQCNAFSVRGISSRVDIIWTTGSTTVRRVDGVIPNITNTSAIYSDLLITQPLRIPDDGRVYQCTVIFNTSPRIVRSRFITLDFPGEYSMQISFTISIHIMSLFILQFHLATSQMVVVETHSIKLSPSQTVAQSSLVCHMTWIVDVNHVLLVQVSIIIWSLPGD